MTIQAIETRYAGCRFRSRLEARWAVFFDRAGIRWEYEPQGLMVSQRLDSVFDNSFSYLPDFWLPDLELWVEVKGQLSNDECWRVMNAAASLSSNNGGGCHDSGGNDLLFLGPIPRPEENMVPLRLHMHKGDLNGVPWPAETGCAWYGHDLVLARDCGEALPEYAVNTADMSEAEYLHHVMTMTRDKLAAAGRLLIEGMHHRAGWPRPLRGALNAARSARFEHGERG